MSRAYFFLLLLLGLIAVPIVCIGIESHEVIEQQQVGQINWTEGWVSSSGKAKPDEKGLAQALARQSAATAANRVAREHLIQLIKGIRIDSESTVNDILVSSETIQAKLEELLDTLKPVDAIIYHADGSAEIKLQLPLRGAFAKLILPVGIKQIEPVKQVKKNGSANSPESPKQKKKTDNASKPIIHTGMIVDAKGLSEVMPAIVPKIVDESGQEVYGPAFVSREYAIQYGMSGYTRTLASAKNDPRIKDNPLIVKGLKTKNLGRSVIVVSNSDAEKLRRASEHLSFLRQGGVIIVLD